MVKKVSLIMIVLLFLVMFSGCYNPIAEFKNEPYIEKIEFPEKSLAPSDSFKVFFVIKNPSATYYTPKIKISYDDERIEVNDYNLRNDKIVELSEISSKDNKNFFLEFEVKSYAKEGEANFIIELYDEDETDIFDTKSSYIQISEKAQAK